MEKLTGTRRKKTAPTTKKRASSAPRSRKKAKAPEASTGEAMTWDEPTHEEIEKRAYEIYLARGGDGSSGGDWYQAERELRAARVRVRKSSRGNA